jgi:hypothetical protein
MPFGLDRRKEFGRGLLAGLLSMGVMDLASRGRTNLRHSEAVLYIFNKNCHQAQTCFCCHVVVASLYDKLRDMHPVPCACLYTRCVSQTQNRKAQSEQHVNLWLTSKDLQSDLEVLGNFKRDYVVRTGMGIFVFL